MFIGRHPYKDTALMYLEFGVFTGRTAKQIASYLPAHDLVLEGEVPVKQQLVGFDSFEGLPEDW